MKGKLLLAGIVLIAVLAACNRKDFVKKIEGTWKINKYIIHNSGNSNTEDESATFKDTTNVGYTLTLNSNYVYTETYTSYTFTADSLIKADTQWTNSADTAYTAIRMDTLRFVDTTITPYSGKGTWQLINSEEDLELLGGGSDTSVRMFNILSLTKSSLNIQNGFKEYDLTH